MLKNVLKENGYTDMHSKFIYERNDVIAIGEIVDFILKNCKINSIE